MADLSDVFFSSISDLNAVMRAKKFSAVELYSGFCDRLERIGPHTITPW